VPIVVDFRGAAGYAGRRAAPLGRAFAPRHEGPTPDGNSRSRRISRRPAAAQIRGDPLGAIVVRRVHIDDIMQYPVGTRREPTRRSVDRSSEPGRALHVVQRMQLRTSPAKRRVGAFRTPSASSDGGAGMAPPNPHPGSAQLRCASAVRPLVAAAAAAIVILNLVDAVFTLLYTGSGMAAEGNPLMDQVLRTSPTAFMAVKLALVSLGVLMLWRLRQRRAAVVGLVATAAAYSTLCLYHLSEAHRLAAL
jgi:hypothetical protein